MSCLSNLPGSRRRWGTPLWSSGSSVHYHGHGRSFCGFTPTSPVPFCFACRRLAIQQQPDVMGPGDVVTRLWRSLMPVLRAITLWLRRPPSWGTGNCRLPIPTCASLVRVVRTALWAFAFRQCIPPAVSMASLSGSRQNAVTKSWRAGCAGEKRALLTLLYIWSGHDR